ncbi:hypothetical protein BJF80_04750 [Serinicoccus sp. CUA-874]|nr:hypothetical protein BJF80_04750 [Serinicoccus sp. CUA-874]
MREAIERAIPLHAGAANRAVSREHTETRLATLRALAEETGFDPAEHARRWELQLGTLGSGNHFIEVSADEQAGVWLFLHSGSRGVGNKIAQQHIRVAAQQCEGVDLPHRDLAYLTEGTPEFDRYIAQMRWAQTYALLNREEMMGRVVRQVAEWLAVDVAAVERVEEINCHHNYTEQEVHFGETVWLSRKGAITPRSVDRASSRGRWARRPTSSSARAAGRPSTRHRTVPGGPAPGGGRSGSSPWRTCGQR